MAYHMEFLSTTFSQYYSLSTTFLQSTENTGVRLSKRNTKTCSKIHVLADQLVTIRLVKRLFLYGENTILPISFPGLLEKQML